jgi:hypothetical protein
MQKIKKIALLCIKLKADKKKIFDGEAIDKKKHKRNPQSHKI